MIVRIPKVQEPYLNILEVTQLLIEVEFLVAMETIKVYSKEDGGSWNLRRIFWYLAGALPVLLFATIVTLASLKYIFS